MRLLALILVVAAALSAYPAAAGAETAAIRPSADVGMPFWCDWGYDWDERCYRDDGPRLPVGGVDDKAWRAAVRFPLGKVPAQAAIVSARLRLHHDGTCVAPRLESVPCDGGSYVLDVHRILSADWFDEREPDIDGRVEATAVLADSRTTRWLSWDVTELVQEWHEEAAPNNGLLVQLSEEQEDYDVSGPDFASSSFAEASFRPRLVVSYTTG
jgi:TGF-beta propeptide